MQATDSRGNLATQTITLNYTIAPVTGATLTANAASPQNAGAAVTFSAGASGGVAPQQFKFLVQPSGGAAQVVAELEHRDDLYLDARDGWQLHSDRVGA